MWRGRGEGRPRMGQIAAKEDAQDAPQGLVVRLPKEHAGNGAVQERRHKQHQVISLAFIKEARDKRAADADRKKKIGQNRAFDEQIAFIQRSLTDDVRHAVMDPLAPEPDPACWEELDVSAMSPRTKKMWQEQQRVKSHWAFQNFLKQEALRRGRKDRRDALQAARAAFEERSRTLAGCTGAEASTREAVTDSVEEVGPEDGAETLDDDSSDEDFDEEAEAKAVKAAELALRDKTLEAIRKTEQDRARKFAALGIGTGTAHLRASTRKQEAAPLEKATAVVTSKIWLHANHWKNNTGSVKKRESGDANQRSEEPADEGPKLHANLIEMQNAAACMANRTEAAEKAKQAVADAKRMREEAASAVIAAQVAEHEKHEEFRKAQAAAEAAKMLVARADALEKAAQVNAKKALADQQAAAIAAARANVAARSSN